jgi:hypothetical protein
MTLLQPKIENLKFKLQLIDDRIMEAKGPEYRRMRQELDQTI